METNFFVKSHGLGNEYIVLNQESIDFSLSPERISKLCNIHFGIGSDGILLKVPSFKADFGLRILNPDGSEAEKSGNGLRIFAKYLFDYGFTSKLDFTIDTPGGIVTAHILELKKGKAFLIKVDMGKVTFIASEIPVLFSEKYCFGETLEINGKEYLIHCVSVGNPHCVVLCNELSESEVRLIGPMIENHPMFPNRINVQFAKVISENLVEALIWERGAGFTLASGSSSCAVASVMIRKGLTSSPVTVKMPGGSLRIEADEDWNIRMTGEVRETAKGFLSEEIFSE